MSEASPQSSLRWVRWVLGPFKSGGRSLSAQTEVKMEQTSWVKTAFGIVGQIRVKNIRSKDNLEAVLSYICIPSSFCCIQYSTTVLYVWKDTQLFQFPLI